MNEKWKIYREQFAVSNQGTVINLKTCKRLTPSIEKQLINWQEKKSQKK